MTAIKKNRQTYKNLLLTFLFFTPPIHADELNKAPSPYFSIQEPEPLTYRLDEKTKIDLQEDLRYYCEDRRLTEDDSKCLYVTAILFIIKEDLLSAKKALILSIEKDPDFAAPRLQLPYVNLWLGYLQEAWEGFQNFDAIYPCEPKTFPGLEEIADTWALQEDTQDRAIQIYIHLIDCTPPNKAELLYKLGSALAFAHRYAEAEKVLLYCLKIDPKNSDAAIRLGYLYLWQKKLSQAREIFFAFHQLPEAQEGLASVALQQGDNAQAECWYKKIKQEKGFLSCEAQLGLARTLSSQLKYTESKLEYKDILQKGPSNDVARRDLLEVKMHTDPVLIMDTQWTQVKENDPTIKLPVVRDYYYNGDIILQLPVYDRWRIDLRGYLGIQKERNILTPTGGLNYNAAIAGGGIASRFFFAQNWVWNAFVNVRNAWGLAHMLYPFQKTTEFQPGSYIVYNGETHLLATSGYVDSFLIKNFTTLTSYLLETQTIDLRYRYRLPVTCHPEIEGWAEKTFIKDHLHNQKISESLWLRSGIPGLEENANLFYLFEHKHYTKLNVNYYSFKQQWRDSVGVKLYGDWNSKTYVELLYYWRWQKTRDLFQPIGNFIFVAPLQILTAHNIQGLIRLRVRDLVKIELGANYYLDTLPLRAWTAYGNLLWAF